MYTYRPPRHELSSDYVLAIRESLASRPDVVAAYWLTTLYSGEQGDAEQEELHIELAEPPEEAASPEMCRELGSVIRVPFGSQLSWVISSRDTLDRIRETGIRVV